MHAMHYLNSIKLRRAQAILGAIPSAISTVVGVGVMVPKFGWWGWAFTVINAVAFGSYGAKFLLESTRRNVVNRG